MVEILREKNLNAIAERIAEDVDRKNKKLVTMITGITTAYEWGDGMLREPLIIKKVSRYLIDRGFVPSCILINDSMDPLTKKHLQKLITYDHSLERLRDYIGVPLYRVPDPYGCHENLAYHFHEKWISKLQLFDVYPVVFFSHEIYLKGKLIRYIKKILNKASEIEYDLKIRYNLKNLKKDTFCRAVCRECEKVSTTRLTSIYDKGFEYKCNSCGYEGYSNLKEVRLPWKIYCGLRWLLYDVDFEPMGKVHTTSPSGSVHIAAHIVEKYFAHQPPLILNYDYVYFNYKEYKCAPTDLLPPKIIESVFLENIQKPLYLNKNRLIKIGKNYRIGNEIYFNLAQQTSKKINLFKELNAILQSISGFLYPDTKIRTFQIVKVFHLFYLLNNYNKKVIWNLKSIDDVDTPDCGNLNRVFYILLSNAEEGIELNNKVVRKICEDYKIKYDDFCRFIYDILLGKQKGPKIATLLSSLSSEELHTLKAKLEGKINETYGGRK